MNEEEKCCVGNKNRLCEFVSGKNMDDKLHLILGIMLVIFGLLSLFCGYIVFAYLSVALTDAYVFTVLLIAVRRSDEKWDCAENMLPTRTAGIFVVSFLLIAIITSFAGMYLYTNSVGSGVLCLTSELDALYFSFVTITTLGYGDYLPITNTGKLLVMFELGSGLLLLFGIFPLLISRLSTFGTQ